MEPETNSVVTTSFNYALNKIIEIIDNNVQNSLTLI